jgi:hypothetical protein
MPRIERRTASSETWNVAVTPPADPAMASCVTNATLNISRYGSGSASDTSAAYGAGLQFNFNKSVYGQVDYMSYYSKSGEQARGPSLSIGVKF